MKLTGLNSTEFILEIVDYQYPQIENEKWDSNWLKVRIEFKSPEGTWHQTDPCMLTWEAARLAGWLEILSIPTFVFKPYMGFIEPVLRFEIDSFETGAFIIRIGFELELRPPWETSKIVNEDKTYWVTLIVTTNELALAAKDLDAQLEQFPLRGETKFQYY